MVWILTLLAVAIILGLIFAVISDSGGAGFGSSFVVGFLIVFIIWIVNRP